jgi:hypothetical protein
MALETAFRILLILETVALMVLIYLALGWLVERYSRKPDSQLKGFFRLICGPLTRPVGRWLGTAPFDRRTYATAAFLAAGALILLAIAVRVVSAQLTA